MGVRRLGPSDGRRGMGADRSHSQPDAGRRMRDDGCGTVTLAAGCEMVSGTTDCDREGTERGGGKYCMARGAVAGLSS